MNIKKYFALLLSGLFVAVFFLLVNNSIVNKEENTQIKSSEKREYNDATRKHQEYLMLRDPATKRIPENIMYLEQQFAKNLPQRDEFILQKGNQVKNVQALTWAERGPNATGGRVRALGIDIRTTGTATLIAGGASGGVWKSVDGGTTWAKKTTAAQIHSVTCVAQDTRVGSQDIWYYGTGENLGNSADATGASYFGNGVFKSTDNGDSWTQLASTNTADNTSFQSDWQYVWNIAVHPTSGNVYAATTGGIYRSVNGGTTWTKVLDPGNNNTLKTDVTIAANGTIYAATGPNGGTIVGIRKSVNDGDNWSDVSPTMPAAYGRTIIKTAPSNPDVVYFFTEGVSGANNTPNTNNHQLWRSVNAGGAWTNISSVIPTTAPALDNLSTQDGYDMLLAVKPDNPNFIIVGGVSIFKIPDVTNDDQTIAQKHIGGYGITANGTANALNDFINHHPDSHIGVFKPGSNLIFYSGNDGGVSLANDITAAPSATFWQTPFRSGFNVSQLYSASIDKTNGSNFISGGLQDRGNWMSRTSGLANWQEVSGGDGSFTEIDPTGTNVFMSTSRGNLFRFAKSDATSPVTATTAITPATLTNALFNSPFDVDDNSGDIMYFSGGNTTGSKVSGIWRTTNASAGTPTWGYFTNSNVTGEQVTAVAVSTASSANVLYYGTDAGKLFRIDAANTAGLATTPTTITGGSFPAGYISSIAVDPANSANVLVTFSNYNVNRLWYSTDSGANWTSVTGNLTGANSPSVRWAKIFTVASVVHYFLGTSTGVYYTVALSGGTTVWTQEAVSSIGNVVVTMLDYRPSDNTLIAATHGRGVFSTTISAALSVELVSFTGSSTQNGISLNWTTATEQNNYGFNIERTVTGKSEWKEIGFVKGFGNSNISHNYSFIDNAPGTGSFDYRIKQIDVDGKSKYIGNVVTVEVTVPKAFALSQNYPNPFNPTTKIKFAIPISGKVSITVYDALGKEISKVLDKELSAGQYTADFNAANLSSGIYYYRLTAGSFVETKKMILMK